jgi:cell division protein ZapA
MSKNKMSVEIYGQSYPIVSKANPAHMREVASLVDHKMRELAEMNPRLDTTKLAVLSACNIADEFLRLKKEFDELMHLVEDETI